MNYEISKDYSKLWDLINQGIVVAGWVLNHRISNKEKSYKDIVQIKQTEFGYRVGSRGVGYESNTNTKESFIENCEFFKIEYIEPINKKHLLETFITWYNSIPKVKKDGILSVNHIKTFLK